MSEIKPIRLGMIGAGVISRRLHVPALSQCPGVEITGAADTDSMAARELGAPDYFTDFRKMLQRDQIDAVVIACPNHLHAEVAIECLEAGKHVLCEKPLAMNAAETERMLRAAEESKCVHMVAFTYSFCPAARYLKHLIDDGRLGQILQVRGSYLTSLAPHLLGWRSTKEFAGSGVLGDIGSHLIHLMRWFGGDIEEVTAWQRKFRTDPASDVEDWMAFLAKLPSGAVGTMEISRICAGRGADTTEEQTIEVYGTSGSAIFSTQTPRTLKTASASDHTALFETVDVPESFHKLEGSPNDPNDGDPKWSYRLDQGYHFIKNIRDGEARTPSFADGHAAQRVMDAALRSCESGAWEKV